MAIRAGGPAGPATVAVEEPITGIAQSPGAEDPVATVPVASGSTSQQFAEYEAAVAELERLLDQAAIDPELRRAIDENLTIIDEAIRQTRNALEADPDDVYLNTHLASTMQRKIDVLQDAARLARAST
jgi:hypothetical protein